MKKFVILLVTFFSFSITAFAAFSDVPNDHHYATSIYWLSDQGVVEGYEDGTFKPEQNVNRAEFLKMLYETIGMAGFEVDLPFPDVPDDEWYTQYVKEAYATRVINGYPDGTFKPDQNINFAEALKIVTNGFYDVNSLYGDGNDYDWCLADFSWIADNGEWYWKYVYVADNFCLIPDYLMGITAWEPGQTVTRGDMAELLYRAQTVKDNNYSPFKEDEAPVSTTEIKFDTCGDIQDYSDYDWFSALIDAISDDDIDLLDLTDVCHSENGGITVFIVPGGYCQSGDIYKFDVDSSSLDAAEFDIKNQGCVSTVQSFGKRHDTVIPVYGHGGDAGCSVQMYYDYEFIDNTVDLIKSYTVCEGDQEGEWMYF
ncbi:S-layer homology domain-containing protein [Patescibacteria group bacterium]